MFRSKIVNATTLDIMVDEKEQQKDWLMHATTNAHFNPNSESDIIATNREIEFLQVFIFQIFLAREGFIFPFVTRAQKRRSSLNSFNTIYNTYRCLKISTTRKTLKH